MEEADGGTGPQDIRRQRADTPNGKTNGFFQIDSRNTTGEEPQFLVLTHRLLHKDLFLQAGITG